MIQGLIFIMMGLLHRPLTTNSITTKPYVTNTIITFITNSTSCTIPMTDRRTKPFIPTAA
jgi:hypothetical protein